MRHTSLLGPGRAAAVRWSRLATAATAAAAVCAAGLGVGTAAAGAPQQDRWKLDSAFGDGGIVRTDFPIAGGHYAWAYDDVIQPNGRIVVAGVGASQVTQDDVAAVARYLPNGDLDPTFGSAGRVMLGPRALYRVTKVALQEIGGERKILLSVATTFRDPYRFRCSIIRLNPDGSLDTNHDADPGVSFGAEGVRVVAFAHNSGFCDDMTLDPDGNIVATVESDGNGGDVSVFRLLAANGALDRTFGHGGRVTVSAPGYQVPTSVALQPGSDPSPRIVVGGLVSRKDGYDWALWRLTADGRLDPTFGHDGRVVTTMRDGRVTRSFDTVDRLAVTADDHIVAVGRYRAWPDGQLAPQDTAAVAEYLPDGALDRSFGDGGRAHLPWDARGGTEATDVTIDGAGRILFAGPFDMPTSGMFLVGGFLADGTPDTRFGPAGFQELYVRGGRDAGEGLALDRRGRLVVAGIAGDPSEFGQDEFGVVRFRLAGQ